MDLFPHISILGEVLIYICLFGISDLIVCNYLRLSPQKKFIYYIVLGAIGSFMMNSM
tara:strand:- start:1814 stop:1984 length:171 start_codon:yes stop_codon:yes gene_type:complete